MTHAEVDEPQVSAAAAAVLQARYLRRDEHGRTVETVGEMLDRVARFVAGAEERHEPGSSSRWAAAFSAAMHRMDSCRTRRR